MEEEGRWERGRGGKREGGREGEDRKDGREEEG